MKQKAQKNDAESTFRTGPSRSNSIVQFDFFFLILYPKEKIAPVLQQRTAHGKGMDAPARRPRGTSSYPLNAASVKT